MAVSNILFITESSHLAADAVFAVVAAPRLPGTAEQQVPRGVAATSSQPFNVATRFAMLKTTTACFLLIGPAGMPDVTAETGEYYDAGERIFLGVYPGNIVSVIEA